MSSTEDLNQDGMDGAPLLSSTLLGPDDPGQLRRPDFCGDTLAECREHSFTKKPSGASSGALGRRDFVRPEFIAMLNDAGGPCWSYESRAGL